MFLFALFLALFMPATVLALALAGVSRTRALTIGVLMLVAMPALAADPLMLPGSTPLPVIPVILQPVVWLVVGIVLTFGITSAIGWLSARRAAATNPAVKQALSNVIDLLQKAQSAIGPNGIGAQQIAQTVEAAYHAHTVATGAPHPDDPRAP